MKPSDREIYHFDLNGFVVLRGALSTQEVADLNATIDAIPELEKDGWHGHVHAQQYGEKNGINLQQIYEAGEPFENLIDHPSWFEKVKYFVGGEGTFDTRHGPVFIDENFASLRGPGEGVYPHSGGHHGVIRCQYRVHNGNFHCGQVNVLMALTDIEPEDGPTVVVPGSHKSNFPHPDVDVEDRHSRRMSVDTVEGSIEVTMKAGDALVFVDAICHGASPKLTEGQRRIVVYRYGPSWGNFRHGYQPSEELLERLTPQRRTIVRPQVPVPRDSSPRDTS